MNALLVANTQTVHASLATHIVPSDAIVRESLPGVFDPGSIGGLIGLNGEISRQASMVAYIDDFKLMLIITIACMPLLLLLRKPASTGEETIHAVID